MPARADPRGCNKPGYGFQSGSIFASLLSRGDPGRTKEAGRREIGNGESRERVIREGLISAPDGNHDRSSRGEAGRAAIHPCTHEFTDTTSRGERVLMLPGPSIDGPPEIYRYL